MNDFAGMEDLLSDFLLEAGEMLSEVESKLTDLEKFPEDSRLLNEIFRGFHTIKGGAGFLNATELVALCNITENVFDKLRTRELLLNPELMVALSAATAEVRTMFDSLQKNQRPNEAPRQLTDALKAALTGQKAVLPVNQSPHSAANKEVVRSAGQDVADWEKLYKSLTGAENISDEGAARDQKTVAASVNPVGPRNALLEKNTAEISGTGAGRSEEEATSTDTSKSTIRVDTDRLDRLLDISGEIGLTKSRLTHLRSDIIQGRIDADTMHELDLAVSQLEKLVMNLQNAVIKTRLQPVDRLFSKYPPLVSKLARSQGKDAELLLEGKDAELDSSLIEDLEEPLLNLLSYTVKTGVETVEERISSGKPQQCKMELSAHQEGDHILISIADDGRGMLPEAIRNKAIAKGLISREAANTLEDIQCLELIFLPGFTGNGEMADDGAAMDLVKTAIHELDGTISIQSKPGKGTVISIMLPLTLAILPVLILRLGDQSFAVPLSQANEILSVTPGKLQLVSGRPTMAVHGKVLPVLQLSQLIGWEQSGTQTVGVLVQSGNINFVMLVDSIVGRDDAVIKPFDAFRPNGVAAVTMSSDGDIVLILDIKELVSEVRAH